MATDKDHISIEDLRKVLSAMDMRTVTDFIYHSRKIAEEMTKDLETEEDESTKTEIREEVALFQRMQALATQVESELKALQE